ncbi:4-hydroxy-tetrahydrodipicolinate synthase [Bradyrhizobium sp. SSBR45G]|uniref:4-hydroxy-tetrahydrodipicolinate synthase family protein n=1 Tax=unclassified Bradyrhizobium TaxID=2631580 RepID=UPI0023429435|nr:MULTISPECIES: 4-hydroxy-tetrahydrodipicolinate synthase [unclassified Bradyrhizobium]GLH78848.1 4-hydroxy-tetrahydrodipicolinate synthase [Bradyrhizobium sp. SSBR45G]GLH86438.1 4-hydroxy-tetrahydrodipicolinate synthase [Bradyrhizobium sp. SSBR45R]
MIDTRTRLQGLWLPLITPFRDGALDEPSLRELIRHYAAKPIDGLVLGATSGEGLALSWDERARLVHTVRDELAAIGRALPICLGVGGVATSDLIEALDRTASWPIDFYLISSPPYVRPSQRGLLAHFTALADRAAHPIVLYNIPYRSAVGLDNDTLLQLAAHPVIAGLKDCCANRAQTQDLIARRPAGFGILTGEDAQSFDALRAGADGAILLSAHLETETFAAILQHVRAGRHDAAAACWAQVEGLTRLLFTEPSPAPAKYWLARIGLIASAQLRLPMVEVGPELAARLDQEIERRRPATQGRVA